MRQKAVWGWRAGLLLLLVALAAARCGDLARQGTGASFLIIEDLRASSGATPSQFGHVLESDVETIVSGIPTIFEDNGEVAVRTALKDPGSQSSPNIPITNNLITVTRYRVVYRRGDGRNTPGVDVPYPFDGAITFTAQGAGASASFVIVRAQAKFEAPLRALRGLGGAVVISTIAEVTFYGHDQTGKAVSAIGTISVNFADWGDPG